ncbi:MAG: stalk domain-containing protein, partial [Bacillota bacterium]
EDQIEALEEKSEDEEEISDNNPNKEFLLKWKELEKQKDELEDKKDELEDKIEALEEELEEGETSDELEELKEEFWEIKDSFKFNIQARRKEIKESFKKEKLEQIQKAKEEMEKELDDDSKILEIDSIISNKGGFDFDTPPVIKSGRTTVPVRAISEGFGAEVTWNSEDKIVGIKKGDMNIELPLDSNEAYINGEKINLDSKSEIMNSRTYVPLRFVSESLGLKVDWDSETETVIIEEENIEESESEVEDSEQTETE